MLVDWSTTFPPFGHPDLPVCTLCACVPVGERRKRHENKKGDYLKASYPWRTSPSYLALIEVGKCYREQRLRGEEITKIMRAFRQVHPSHGQELGRAVRYLPQVAAWLDEHWEQIGGKFLEFAHAWCREQWGCKDQ